MEYIEKNFHKIKNINLNENELLEIKNFINNLKNYKSIEGICLMPSYIETGFYNNLNPYCYIEIIILIENKNELNEIEDLISRINKNLSKIYVIFNKFVFSINFIKNPSCQLKRTIISSYILYDRNGFVKNLQDTYKNTLRPYDVIAIENIQDLEQTEIKKLTKKIIQ